MCCSSGVCGPRVDPVLVQFAADLDWLKSQQMQVERFSLSQNPAAFAANEVVRKIMTDEGPECLPILLVDGKVIAKGRYPDRDTLSGHLGIPLEEKPAFSRPSHSNSCCGGSDQCC